MLRHQPPPIDKRRVRSTASKQKIAQAAEQLVLARGRTGLTTSALVEAAGVSERTVFNHFKKLDDALVFRIAHYLEPMIDHPPFPSNLEIAQVPAAITEHFRTAVDSHEVQDNFYRFLVLATALSEEEFEGMAQEILLTLGSICERFCGGIDELYPALTPQQSLTNALYTINLLMGVIFAFGALAQQFEEAPGTGPIDLETIDVGAVVPLIHSNIDQVAGGTPVY